MLTYLDLTRVYKDAHEMYSILILKLPQFPAYQNVINYLELNCSTQQKTNRNYQQNYQQKLSTGRLQMTFCNSCICKIFTIKTKIFRDTETAVLTQVLEWHWPSNFQPSKQSFKIRLSNENFHSLILIEALAQPTRSGNN